jgi:hypothetical protein
MRFDFCVWPRPFIFFRCVRLRTFHFLREGHKAEVSVLVANRNKATMLSLRTSMLLRM